METTVIARIDPGILFQIARSLDLSFVACERLNKLQYVELEIEFGPDGNHIDASIKKLGFGDPPPEKRTGWPFKSCAEKIKAMRCENDG